jgi:hypothetical protein
VQGRLRNEYLSITIDTHCAYSGKPLQIEVDSQLKVHVQEAAARPMVFTPQIDWEAFHDPSIIDAY